RRLTVFVAAAVLVAASALAGAPARAAGGSFTGHTWPSPGAPGARDYWVYVPAGPAVAGRPLVVFLHGCTQTAQEAAQLTRFNELADRLNFIVVYPQQRTSPQTSGANVDGNSAGCWNWFIPQNETRDSGEAGTI